MTKRAAQERVVVRTDIHGYAWKRLAAGGGYVMIQRDNYPGLPEVITDQVWRSWYSLTVRALLPEPVHHDHPLRHWDRTCPACIRHGEPGAAEQNAVGQETSRGSVTEARSAGIGDSPAPTAPTEAAAMVERLQRAAGDYRSSRWQHAVFTDAANLIARQAEELENLRMPVMSARSEGGGA